jgi:NodT family efflux transporter outer membrane factor (OMF) lipoprotein
MKFCHLLVLLTVLQLTACAQGPDYASPATRMPGAAHFDLENGALNENTPEDDWWRGFHDTLLDTLEQQALNQNLDLQAALARIRQARAERDQVSGADLPQVDAVARQAHDVLSLNSEGYSNIPSQLEPHPRHGFDDYRAGLDASWELDLFGYNARALQAATARLGSVREQAHTVALEVTAEVASDYVDYRGAAARLALAQRNAACSEEQSALMRLRVQAGLASELELAPLEQARQNAQAQLAPLQVQQRAAQDRLALLLGQPPEALIPRLQPAMGVPQIDGAPGVGLPSDLLLRRPDIRRAERELAAASADIGVAVAAQYPRFTLVSSLGFDSIYPGQLTAQASRYWSFAPQLSLPLFAGGELHNQVKARQAAYDAALANYRHAVLVALSDSETALIRYARESQRLTRLEAARQAAQQSLALQRRRVAAGEAPQDEVLQAESQYLLASDLQTQSQSARALDLISLYKALGGGWRQTDQH